MNRVFSRTELTEKIAKLAPPPAPSAAGERSPKPIAIVAVHGISPFQQYAFQDQFADGLLAYLTARDRPSGHTWSSVVHWPQVKRTASRQPLKPTALRLYRDDEKNPETPTTQVYDVYEGYWSPYSKGKTNVVSLLMWLIGCTFLATSSTARVPAKGSKVFWDVCYLGAFVVLGAVVVAAAFASAAYAWASYTTLINGGPNSVTALDLQVLLKNPMSLFSSRSLVYVQLVITVVIGYFLVQLGVIFKAMLWNRRRADALLMDESRKGDRAGNYRSATVSARMFHLIAMGFVLFVVAVLFVFDWITIREMGLQHWPVVLQYSLAVVFTAGFVQLARYFGDFLVENVLGDIQVYTTRDTNAGFYAIRSAIIDAVTDAVLGPLNAVDSAASPDGKSSHLYDRIHIAGHSLGSTVALDVLIRLRQSVEERVIDSDAWNRVRSLTTFGAALEKTRYFFDVRQPTVSAAQGQWENDVYGRFFSPVHANLDSPGNPDGVIYWSNLWYPHDVVANAIVSYQSAVKAGASSFAYESKVRHGDRPVCQNRAIPHGNWWYCHGDYLSDPLFWQLAGPIVTG